MRSGPGSLRLLLAGSLLAAAGLTAALSSASAGGRGPAAVTGGLQQAYKASYYRAGAAELEAANRPIRDTDPLVVSATRVGHKALEPTMGVTKQGNAFMVAADFDTPGGQLASTTIMASYDGNKTWKDVTPRVGGSVTIPPTTLDPYIYVDQTTGRIYSDDLIVGCSVLQWSDDQGKTWSRGNPAACDAPVDDHQTIVTGKPRGGLPTVGYPNYLYYCVNKVADVQCARSLDGGTTFGPSGAPAFAGVQTEPQDGSGSDAGDVCGSLHGHIVTDPAGRLFLPKGHCGNPWLAVSEDGGQTWTRTLVNRMGAAGIQTSVASDTAGNLYYMWWGAKNFLPYMAVSRDHGKTFGPALLVAPPGVKAVNFPTIDAGSPGHVAITFPGTTDEDRSTARPWNYYMAVSTNALAPLPTFHSATANKVSDPIHRGACNSRCGNMFDFLDVVLAPSGAAWGVAVDTCTSVKCVRAEGPKLKSDETPSDAQGIVVRQLAGPGARKR
ncbi:MAG: exo-alpha-sialidase [Frankiaceae bacterium]|nr:exo-alpha-sialidase [Frankiaceae bacterium]